MGLGRGKFQQSLFFNISQSWVGPLQARCKLGCNSIDLLWAGDSSLHKLAPVWFFDGHSDQQPLPPQHNSEFSNLDKFHSLFTLIPLDSWIPLPWKLILLGPWTFDSNRLDSRSFHFPASIQLKTNYRMLLERNKTVKSFSCLKNATKRNYLARHLIIMGHGKHPIIT